MRLAADAAATVPTKLCQQIVRLKVNIVMSIADFHNHSFSPALSHLLSLLPIQASQSALKEAYLMALCSRSFAGGRTIVFFKTKQKAHRAKILFGLCGLPPAGVNLTQVEILVTLEYPCE